MKSKSNTPYQFGYVNIYNSDSVLKNELYCVLKTYGFFSVTNITCRKNDFNNRIPLRVDDFSQLEKDMVVRLDTRPGQQGNTEKKNIAQIRKSI